MHHPRRDILKLSFLAAGGLLLPIRLQAGEAPHSSGPAILPPTAFIRITPHAITLIMPDTEFGQGIWTSAATLIAEELEVRLDQIQVEPAPPDAPLYATDGVEQATGGSTSTIGDWKRLREAGARARIMLVQAAAQSWNVAPAACRAQAAAVHHDATGRALPYGELAARAATFPVPGTVTLKPVSAWRLAGRPQKRLDTPGKVTGAATFGIDVVVPGMKIGTVAACPERGGRLAGIDEQAARAVPGVRDIVRLPDAVAVIADHYWAARQGLRAARPQWESGPNAGVSTAMLHAALEDASARPGAVARDSNDAPARIASAHTQLHATYQLPFLAHAPMEPINTTIHIREDGADLWVGTQVPVRAQDAIARVTGLKPDRIAVHNQLMGGAFGRRLDIDSIEQAARIARALSYPVKLIWSREEDITQDMFRPAYRDVLSAGLDAHGRIAGWTHKTAGSSITARYDPGDMKGALDPDAVECAANTPYDIPAARIAYVRCEPQGVATAWWRGVGPTHNVFVVESFMDECAAAAGADPVAYRRALLRRNPRALAVLDLAAAKSGWGTKLPAGQGRGISLQFAFSSYVAHVCHADVSAQGEIRIHRCTVAIDCGQRINPDTITAQVEGGLIFGLSMALYSDITFAGGHVQQSNFDNYRVLRINRAPAVDVHQVDSHEEPGGVGETGTAAASAALGNAIFAATGKRLRRLPFSVGDLRSA